MAQIVSSAPEPVGLILNGIAMPEPGLLVVRDGQLLTRIEDLRQLGIDPLPGAAVLPIDGQAFVEVGAIAGLSAQLDPDRANLRISASADAFPHLAFGPPARHTPLSPSLPAQFLDYNLALSSWGGKTRLTGLLDAGVSGKWGVMSTSLLVTGRGLQAVRLDSAYRLEFPEKRLRLVLGDAVSRPPPGGQPQRFGGIQFGTDLSLDPQALNFPLPVMAGSAALPSTVELLSEAQRQSYEVAPGAFDIALQPRMTGAGQVTMSIRDLAGNTRQIVRNFYTSADLLRPGLTDFTIEAGALRKDYGTASNRYGAFFAAAGVRHPLASSITAQARVETGKGISVFSLGGSFVVGSLAEVSVANACSSSKSRTGYLVRAQARRTTPAYSLSASFETTTHGFQRAGDLAPGTGAQREIAFAASFSVGSSGGLNLAHAYLEQKSRTAATRSFSISSVSWDGSFLGGFLGAGVQRTTRSNARDAASSWSLFASYSIALGPRRHVSAFAESGRAAAAFSVALPDGPGLGARALAGMDRGHPWLEGSLAARTAAGDLSFEVNRRGTATGAQVTARGAVIRVDRTVLATPFLGDGFALIDVAGEQSVTVNVENRPLARLAGQGHKVVATGLQPYAPNHVGVDASGMAIDTALATADQVVTPGWRRAAAVHFGDRIHRPAMFRLVDEAGDTLPVGATVRWPGGTGVVGYDGVVWIDDPAPGGELIIGNAGKQCRSFMPDNDAHSSVVERIVLRCQPYIDAEKVL